MPFEDITDQQRKLVINLIENLATGNYSSEFWALSTMGRGWFIQLEGQGGAQEKQIEGFEETDLLALQSEGYIILVQKQHDFTGTLKPKAYKEYKKYREKTDIQVDFGTTCTSVKYFPDDDGYELPLPMAMQKLGFDEDHLRQIETTSEDLIKELRQNYNLSRKQAASWFRWTLGVSLGGFCLLAFGIWLYFTKEATASMINSVAGVVTEFLAAVFFKQAHAANERQDRYHNDLITRQKILDAVQVVRLITDVNDRNRVTETIIRQLLGIESTPPSQ